MSMSHEEYELLFREFIAEGKITQEDIDNKLSGVLSSDMKDAIYLYHTLYCNGDHIMDKSEMSEDACLFYLEESVDVGWELASHKKWAGLLKEFMETFGLDTVSDAVHQLGALVRATNFIAKELIDTRILISFLRRKYEREEV
jgi:hypothetical protein